MRRWWADSPARIRFAAVTLAVCLAGWPVTAVLDLLGFPVFKQVMLALSWLAPVLTAVNVLFTAQVHERQGNGD